MAKENQQLYLVLILMVGVLAIGTIAVVSAFGGVTGAYSKSPGRAVAHGNGIPCFSSDNFENKNIKGTAEIAGIATKTDVCRDDKVVIEYSCLTTGTSDDVLTERPIRCDQSQVCYNGACIQKSELQTLRNQYAYQYPTKGSVLD